MIKLKTIPKFRQVRMTTTCEVSVLMSFTAVKTSYSLTVQPTGPCSQAAGIPDDVQFKYTVHDNVQGPSLTNEMFNLSDSYHLVLLE